MVLRYLIRLQLRKFLRFYKKFPGVNRNCDQLYDSLHFLTYFPSTLQFCDKNMRLLESLCASIHDEYSLLNYLYI